MKNNYYIDLESISLTEYEKELGQTELMPSRKLLQEDIKKRFTCLNKHGIKNLIDILSVLKTPDKIKRFSEKSGLPEEYLAILKREIASRQPKPVNIKDFPGILKATVKKLERIKITNTKQLFNFVKTEKERKELSKKSGLSYKEILELTKLTDVSRIRWVGSNFARLLVDSPSDTVEKVSKAEYESLYIILMKINEEKKYFKGKFGQHDMKLCIDDARNVPNAIKY
jgi:hypothetical protein